ncbi:hypothetical protein D8S82_17185 [Mycobacterium hodleri]|uniref:Uncharacterized protein n=1 Tax=Mycolicibacterium hodleri TaxID=49897 RepID=A0A544VZG4_9MYCO|nr:hypothetical protein [Mycolicibacterium hodleri]TQR85364.1 hypothetical protein D8S82_17185 [Mycolicibacterium hodleri]
MNRQISRQALLRGAIASGAGALFWPRSPAEESVAGAVGRLRSLSEANHVDLKAMSLSNVPQNRWQESTYPAIPAELKIRGVNHVLKFEDLGPQDSNGVWAAMWRVWDWDGWIRPQLDDIATVGNTVRFWGSTLALALSNVSLNQYLAQWKQALDHIQTLGLYVYPCGGDLGSWGGYTVDESVKCYSELASLLATYDNVIGMDIVNEAALLPWHQTKPSDRLYRQPQPYEQFVQQLGEAVRAHAIPITYSRSLRSAEQWMVENPLDSAGDFLDFHIYYKPTPADSLGVYETSWGKGKNMVIGEFGMNTTESAEARSDYYEAIRKLTSNDPNCRGAFAWAAYDPLPTPDWEYGLFDRQRTLRNDIADPFSAFRIDGL